jgi:hypothetical protein
MTYPFLLSYARRDAKIDGAPPLPDPHFEAFLQRLNQRVTHLTGGSGFVDQISIQPGQDWPEELAEALRTSQTMVCLYSPSYFTSEHCGKEMQVLLDRRRNYIRASAGKKPANIIPVLWHPTDRRIPKTLPKIQYQAPNLDPERYGAWNLGDQGRDRELKDFADQIALRVRDAADETPLPALAERPRMNAVRSAFHPPPLPLPEFESPEAMAGPDAVTFVYASSRRWNEWPWAPPDERAVLHLAAAVAKGSEMESNQLTFNLADGNMASRLASLRRKNNVVILLLDAASLDQELFRARIREYDRPEHWPFAVIVTGNGQFSPEFQTKLNESVPYFAKRVPPHLYLVQSRENFSEVVAEALDALKLAILRNPQAPNLIGNVTEFQTLPAVNGPGQIPTV